MTPEVKVKLRHYGAVELANNFLIY